MLLRRPLAHAAVALSVLARRGQSFSLFASASAPATTTTTAATTGGAASKIAIPQSTLDAIDGLQPAALWRQFAILSSIPRPSKKEDAVIAYIKDFADERGLRYTQDHVGNLVVFHPGSGQGKAAPSVVLQGHVDMVTEKNGDTVHDFEKDPILLRRITKTKRNTGDGTADQDEIWLGATGTTLGSDNGIGVAATLALLETPTDTEDGWDLPPLEALFTVDEETGLTGAMELDATALGLTGKTMLNLDTEEFGELYVGCSGGGESTLTLPVTRAADANIERNAKLMEVRVEGLLGGHSGINIHEGRGNAVLLCAATTQMALRQVKGLALVSLTGGDKHNAIPREARALLFVPDDDAKEALLKLLAIQLSALKEEYGTLEQKLRIELVDADEASVSSTCSSPLDAASTTKLLSMLLSLPFGAIKFSHMLPDLVETSNNVASISMTDDMATVLCSTRSSLPSALEATRDRLAAVANLAGANMDRLEAYPGWNPNPDSQVLQLGKRILTEQLKSSGKTPGVKAIHAGLECGLLIEKMGGNVDALSFGPTITGAHSPDENVLVDTVPPFFDLAQAILAELAQKR